MIFGLIDCNQIIYNKLESLEKISDKTSAVIVETIQGASGFIEASQDFLNQLKKKCIEFNVLIIFDEIQTCFGRTGKLF